MDMGTGPRRENWRRSLLVLGLFVMSPPLSSLSAIAADKPDTTVVTESDIKRRRVKIFQTTKVRTVPARLREALDRDLARRVKLDQKTVELIKELETLSARPGQAKRQGALKMRLAELYYERAQFVATSEASAWEARVNAWNQLDDSKKTKLARPQLKTPKADALRKKALAFYLDLEKMSKGGDLGRGQMIVREDVLYFLGATFLDLGDRKRALARFEELIREFPRAERLFTTRLNLADLYFEQNDFSKALPYYLQVAGGEGAPKGEDFTNLKAYAFYKLAWCYLNTEEVEKSILAFKRTLDVSKEAGDSRRLVFEREVLPDLARAYAMTGRVAEAEKYFASLGDVGAEFVVRFRNEAAIYARNTGKLDLAMDLFAKLSSANPMAYEARDFDLEVLALLQKKRDFAKFTATLANFAKKYGHGSEWLNQRSAQDGALLEEDLVGMLRREAKNNHRAAQVKDSVPMFGIAKGLYDVYFSNVPTPNKEAPEALAEMRFYYSELLYRLGEFKKAADSYAEVPAGKFQSAAGYARVLSLQAASTKDKSLKSELVQASEAFMDKNPNDTRTAGILFNGAEESFKEGNSDEALRILTKLAIDFSKDSKGVEAAERALFVLDKTSNLKESERLSQVFLANKTLVKTGGERFAKNLKTFRQKTLFKEAESLPDSSLQEKSQKAESFLNLAESTGGEVKERALNNARIFAKESSNASVLGRSAQKLLKEYPDSQFTQSLYLEIAEVAANKGEWNQALANYSSFISKAKANAKPKSGTGSSGSKAQRDAQIEAQRISTENAEWNEIFIQARLEGVHTPELEAPTEPTPALTSKVEKFVSAYPKSKVRAQALDILAFRKNAKLGDLQKLRALPELNPEERKVLNEAETVLMYRSGQNAQKLLDQIASAKNASALQKKAIGRNAFNAIAPSFETYQKGKIDFNLKQFANSLKSRINQLESLEKRYQRVVSVGDGELALQSLDRLASLYQRLALDLENAPGPKEDLLEFSKPLKDKAKSFVQTCLEKAVELRIVGSSVADCRKTATGLGVEAAGLGDELIPLPRWISQPKFGAYHPLLEAAAKSLGKKRLGEAELALEILASQKSLALSEFEISFSENLKGLVSFGRGDFEAAARFFRKASESFDAEIKKSAVKNLAALYVYVGDYGQAEDLLAPYFVEPVIPDFELSLLSGLAQRGMGDIKFSLDAYDAGLLLKPNSPELLMDRALALGASNLYGEAAKAIQRYIEIANPPKGHVSRQLFRTWKGKSNESLPETDM